MLKSKAKGSGTVGFNVVPLIDCVFQLLLFLMVTRHFYELSTVEVELPPAVKAENKMQEMINYTQVVVNVVPPHGPTDKTTRVVVDGYTVAESIENGPVPNWDKLIDVLKRKQADAMRGDRKKPLNVILRAGAGVPYETIGSVMLATSMSGIKYWWIQAYIPRGATQDDNEKRIFLGAESGG